MGKFNDKLSPASLRTHEGAQAFAMSKEMELYTATVCSAMSDKYYQSENEAALRIARLVETADHEFVAKLAIYAREKMNLRSIPLYLLCCLAKKHRGDSLVRRATERVVSRADEIAELLACYQYFNGRTEYKALARLSNQIKEGLAAAFNKFDEYQFAKYNRKGAVTLRDALFITHPHPKDEKQQAIFDKITKQTLETPYTWETELSALGEREFEDYGDRLKATGALWTELMESGRLGYMALLRNLRNIISCGDYISDHVISSICTRLSNPDEVRRSRQLPFRFFAAYRELQSYAKDMGEKVRALREALEAAVSVAAENIAGFDKDTSVVVACDVSGSMYEPVGGSRSSIRCYDIGLLLGMLLDSRCTNVVTGIFGSEWKVTDFFKIRPHGITTKSTGGGKVGILERCMALDILAGEVGYSTRGDLVISSLIETGHVADKVMMFTDCQMTAEYGGRPISEVWDEYKATVAPNAKLYVFDLAGYGKTPFTIGRNDVYMIAGWSDKVFDVLSALDSDKIDSALEAVNEITL